MSKIRHALQLLHIGKYNAANRKLVIDSLSS
jgi:hypothetical protein